MLKSIINRRRLIQVVFAAALYLGIQYYAIPIVYILIAGSALGLIFGKVFCRWMCPIGLLMELLTGGRSENRAQQMYMYHKLGCPIAWVSGFLNRYSFVKIKRDPDTCTSCSKCDSACYISTLNKDYSLYKKDRQLPDRSFSCSKCLECVTSCPTGSLSYTAGSPRKI